MYLNGRPIAEDIATAKYQGAGPLLTGAYNPTNNAYRYPYHGAIDQVRVWNHARSANAIAASMHRVLADNEPGLLGYWLFPDRQSIDLSGNNRPGQIHGNPSPAASPFLSYKVFAGFGNRWVKTSKLFYGGQWDHFAAIYDQS